MPRYYFHLVDGAVQLLDPKGTELPDDSAAMQHGSELARGFKWIRWSVRVTAETGHLLGRIDPR
jgi:hypothetical protein